MALGNAGNSRMLGTSGSLLVAFPAVASSASPLRNFTRRRFVSDFRHREAMGRPTKFWSTRRRVAKTARCSKPTFFAASDTMMVATMPPEMGPAAVRAISRPRMGPAMKKRPTERAIRPTNAIMTVFHSCLMSFSFMSVPMWTRMTGRLTAA